MSIVVCYMVPSVIAVFCATALALREPQSSPIHRLMAGILAVLAVCMACYAQFFSYRFVHVIWFDLIYMMLAPFGAVLFYLFILTLTSLKEVSRKKRLTVFVPVAAYAVFLLALALWMNPDERLLYIGQVVQGEGAVSSSSVPLRLMTVFGWRCISYVFPVVVTGIFAWSGFKLHKYYHMLYDYYASSTQIQRVYGISIIVLSVVFLPVAVFLMLVPHYASIPHWVPWTLSMTECLLIILVAAIVFNLVFKAADLRAALSAVKEPPFESIQDQRKQQIADTLDKSVRESKVFLDPTLTIMSLAQEIGVPLRALRRAEPRHRVDMDAALVELQLRKRRVRDEQGERRVESAGKPDHHIAALDRLEPRREPLHLRCEHFRRIAGKRHDATLLRRLAQVRPMLRQTSKFLLHLCVSVPLC